MDDIEEIEMPALATDDSEARTQGRRREHKHPPSEARRLIVQAAHTLPVGRPLWLAKRSDAQAVC